MTIRDLSKLIAVVAGLLVLVVIFVFVVLAFRLPKEVPSNIVAFHPAPFKATAAGRFFYSIGDELKYSDDIEENARTLLRGKIENSLVSPDNTKMAVVMNGALVIVDVSKPSVNTITKVGSIYRELKPIGQSFFRDQDFQWSRNSQSLYVIKDEYYASKGSQLFSEKGELWKYELSNGSLHLVLKPFRACSYFFGLKTGIYFSEPNGLGNLQLKYFDGNTVINVGAPDGNKEIPDGDLPLQISGSPFFSFSDFDYWMRILPNKGATLSMQQSRMLEDLQVNGKPYLQITEGQNFKGPYYCASAQGSAFLPGDRYLLFNFACSNYRGQLLIDALTGAYMTLPDDSRVYVSSNTENYRRYRVTSEGIEAGRRLPDR